ncbi:hypothetical protein SDJN03_07293, partial [Cucurbita argyrosperma subsp. sororia]
MSYQLYPNFTKVASRQLLFVFPPSPTLSRSQRLILLKIRSGRHHKDKGNSNPPPFQHLTIYDSTHQYNYSRPRTHICHAKTSIAQLGIWHPAGVHPSIPPAAALLHRPHLLALVLGFQASYGSEAYQCLASDEEV